MLSAWKHHVEVVLDVAKGPRDIVINKEDLEHQIGDSQVPDPNQNVIERGCKSQGWFIDLAHPIIDRAGPYGRAEGAIEDDAGALGWVVCDDDPVWRDMGVEKELEDFRVRS